jgi:class 3 adenylate cyclase/tetratricopeptide (TPR) repeat protein
VVACTSCGRENPEDARFCNTCGAVLAAAEHREERKVVTVLFCDLVGFTSRAEQLDPEDVRALLAPYHARLRSELERFGGTVEKFVGDAVMAVFGAPSAHEDDPERAVRAAFAIRDWLVEQGEDLRFRIAVNTGDALVALGARPSEGEAMVAGDVVNTAARMQAEAPVNGILAGEQTYRASAHVIDYREAGPVAAKGKSQPIQVWEAVRARSHPGVDVVQRTLAPLVGRRHELDLLRATLVRVRDERSPQLLTLIGVPGIGKSRLVYELSRIVEADPELVVWRQGRSLPYGEGVSFWALGEMVKAQVGVLESDDAEEASEKLASSVRDLLPDAGWVETQLRQLLGIGATQELAGARREEAFAAWRRFLEAMAERRTTVAVFEDLHWADEGMLDFIDHLVEWTSGVPLFVVCTARPELLARRPGWGGGMANTFTLSLSPLSGEDTAHLVHALLEQTVMPAEIQRMLVERAGGNALYAEEFTRLFAERGSEVNFDQRLPESVQGIIAARLDALPGEEKALLQGAAVVGKVFWLGAVCEVGGAERAEAERRLHALERKEFVRRERNASVVGEVEYAFRHVLIRDVAYGQIPRLERADAHRLAAEWIERLGRPEDHAELLAHHYMAALELERAVGKHEAVFAERARLAFRRAGDRATALAGYEAAARFYASALELCPSDDPERPDLLLRQGRTLFSAEASGLELLTEALEAFRGSGDEEGAAAAATAAGLLLWTRGHRDDAYAYVDEAVELLSARPPSFAKANALLRRAGFHLVTGEFPECLRLARDALPMVEHLGLATLRARVPALIGWSRVGTGDPGGLSDLQQAVEITLETNSFDNLHSSFENLRSAQFALGRLADASVTLGRHAESAERLGEFGRRWLQVLLAGNAFLDGRWEEALGVADAFLEEVEAGSPHYLEPPCRAIRAAISLARGELRGAASDADKALAVSRRTKDRQVLSHALGARAIVALAENRREEATELSSELEGLGIPLIFPLTFGWPTLADVAWLLSDLDRRSELLNVLGAIPVVTPWADAARAIAGGDFVHAAETLERMGDAAGAATARLRAAEWFVEAGRRPEANAELAGALGFYRATGATAYVRKAEALLAPSA